MATDDQQVLVTGQESAPASFRIPGNGQIRPKTIYAKYDGSGAGSSFLPALKIVSDGGELVGVYPTCQAVAAGGSAGVGWFPWLDDCCCANSSGAGAAGITSLTSPTGTLSVGNPTGPSTTVDMPATGVAAGSYGDANNVAQVTLDAEGRVTAAANVALASGGTISDITSTGGTITVGSPTGPTTNVDLPASGVAAGSYGDSSHSPQVTIDAEGRVTAATSVAIAGGSSTIGFEIGYTQKTSATFITSASTATPTTILSPGALTFDGQPVLVTFYSPDVQTPSSSGGATQAFLYEGSSIIARLIYLATNSATAIISSMLAQFRFTPTAGSHTYTVAGIANQAGTPFVDGGPGGGIGPSPCFVRFTKV